MPGNMTVSLRINADGSAAITNLKQVEGAVGSVGKKGQEASAGVKALSTSLQGLAVTAGAALSVTALAESFLRANNASIQMQRGFTAVAGSSAAAAAEMAYISEQANRLGMAVADVAPAYLSLEAATKGTVLAGQSTRDIFESVSLAMAKLGRSSADAAGALTAIQQSVSKQSVSAEELTQQLGERLPGATKAFADSLGVTTQQLMQMMANGDLTIDMWAKFAEKLREVYDDGQEISGLESEWRRFNNAINDAWVALNNVTGATNILSGALANATSNAKALASWLNSEGWNNFASQADRMNALMGERIRLQKEFTAQAQSVANLDALPNSAWIMGMKRELPGAQEELRRLGNELGGVTAKIARMQQGAKDLEIASGIKEGDAAAASAAKNIEKTDKAFASLLGTYDKGAAKQAKMATAEKELSAYAQAHGKDTAWVAGELKKYESALDGAGKAGNRAAGGHKAASAAMSAESRELDALITRYLPARANAEELAKGVATLDAALASGKISQAEYNEMLKAMGTDLDVAAQKLQAVIDTYDREGAAARKLAEDRAILNEGLAKSPEKVEQINTALANLTAAEQKNANEGDAWAEVWKNAIKRIDDSFAQMWENLITGTGSTLDNLKQMLGKWLAEVAHALLTKPLVVALTTSLTGTAGAAGTATGAVSQASSGLGGLSNITSLFSTAWSLGSSFLEGVAAGFSSMFSGTAGTALSFAWAGATSGTASGMAAGLGVAMPYIAPLLAIAGFAISKFFADQEPRYGAWSATVGNNPRGLEDWENGPDNYARGGFGLTFGLSDNGSKNMDASEMKDQFNAFAQITQMLADFFGKSLSAKIQAGLESAAFANWTHDGVMRLANNEDMASAFKGIIDMIADQAAVTGEHIGVAFEYALGDLSGTAEEMATQVQVAMQAAAAYTLVAEAWNTHIGAALGLTGDFGADIRTLGGYVATFANDGENAAQTLARLSAEIDALEYAASLTSTSLSGLSGTALVQMAESLADAFGNIDVASQALSFYAENFQAPGETFQRQARAAMEQIQRVWDDFDFEKLMPVIPSTRAEFTSLVNSLDLTTEAGRKLFAALMQLSPAFDGLFDSQEAFQNWIAPVDPVTGAMDRIGKLFESWGIQLPKDRDGLEALYRSGSLTTEQMAILGAYLDDLRIIFDGVGESIANLTDLHIRLAQALGDDATALRLQREQELANAANDAARALLMMIYAAEDLGKGSNKFNYAIRDARDPRLTGGQYNTELLIQLSKLIGGNYKAFDNGTGGIKPDELRGLLKDIAGPDEIDRLIQALDTNGDGTIGALERLPLLIAANIGPLFDQFDTNKSGGLDFEELKKVLGGTLDDAQLKAIFAMLDINGDGLISKLEATNLQQIAAINGQKDAVVGKLSDVVLAIDGNRDAIVAKLVEINTSVQALGPIKEALLPPPNLIRDEAGDSASLRAALADLQAEIAALRAGTEKAAQANERGSTALQGAAEKLHNAATAIPERLEVVVPSLYSEAGF